MIYLDSSVVFSLYGIDSNTTVAISLIRSASEPLLLTPFCELETLNAFSLARFRTELSENELVRLRHDFQLDLEAAVYQLRPLPESAFTRAKDLAEKITPSIGVRAADLLHIAAAIELGAKFLYTFDQKQHRSAQAAGLKVNQLPKP
jgi:predicted nucleic acid-binding protein